MNRELHRLRGLIDSRRDFDYEERASLARSAQALVHEAAAISRRHPRDPAAQEIHGSAAAIFRSAIERAYPPGFWDDYRRLKGGHPEAPEAVVRFLEADPWFFRSGYIKADLIRFLRRLEFPQDLATRLRRVVLAVVDRGDRREFRRYCRLARSVDAPDLREGLALRLGHDDPAVRRRARWVLDALEKTG